MRKLTEYDCRTVLKKHGIKVPKAELAKSEEEAVGFADKIGYPVVLKLISHQMLHKTNVGGVIVNVDSEEAVRRAYKIIVHNAKIHGDLAVDGILVEEMLAGRQVIVGSTLDPQFGQVIMFGIGGIFVEVLKDVSFRVVPVTKKDALNMIHEIKTYEVLTGVRGQKAINEDALADAIVKVSKMIESEGDITELDINPLFVTENEAIAGDARIIMA